MVGQVGIANSKSYDLPEATGVIDRIIKPLGEYMLVVKCNSNSRGTIALVWCKDMTGNPFSSGGKVQLFNLKKVLTYFKAEKGEILQQ